MPSLDQQFTAIFAKYLELNHHVVADIVKVKLGQLAFGLYKGCAKRKASKSKIAADVHKHQWDLFAPKGFRNNPEFKRKPGEPDNSAALARFQAAVIALRVQGIGFPAVGWLAACQRLGVAGRADVRAEKILGDCEVYIQSSIARVRMTNSTPGAKSLMDKYPIASQAITDMIADMQTYMDAKMRGLSGTTVGGYR